MTLTQITEKGIKDGEIINADINASAAIAGSKIAPTFTADGSVTKATPQFKIHSTDNDMTMGEELGRYAIWTSDGSAPGGGEVFRIKTESSSSLGLDYTTRLYNRNGSGGGGTEISLGNGQGSIYLATNTTGNAGGITRMAVMSSGNVGIGTTSPDTKLHLEASNNGVTAMTSANNRLRFTDTDTDVTSNQPTGVIEFESKDSGNEGIQAYIACKGSNTGQGSLHFATGKEASSTLAERMIIDQSGNVGLGISGPNTKLDISATAVNSGTLSTTNCKQLGQWIQAASGSNTSGDIQTGIAFAEGHSGLYSIDAGSGAAQHLAFFTGAAAAVSERMRLHNNGRISIGTTSADATLHIKSPDGANTRLILEQNQDAANYQNGIDFKNAGTQYAGITAGKDSSNNSFGLTFHTGSSYTTRMQITDGGDVAIINGNLQLASGKGIDFSNTFDGSNVSGVSSSSELLDDYEEGTFQPILKRLMSNNVTETNFYTQQTRQGNYTRIGDRVWITGRCHWNGGSTGSGTTILTNLPFTINTGGANEIPLNIGYRGGWNYTNITAYGGQNMNRFYINFFDSNGSYPLSPSAASSQGSLYFAAHYELV